MIEICLTIADDGKFYVSSESMNPEQEVPEGQAAGSLDEAIEMVRQMASEGAVPVGDGMPTEEMPEEEAAMQGAYKAPGPML
jgi:hypothetical protein